MKWTTKKPTRQGWYWYRREPKRRFDATGVYQCVVYVYDALGGMFVEFQNGEVGKVTRMGGEWSSEPLPKPDEHKS